MKDIALTPINNTVLLDSRIAAQEIGIHHKNLLETVKKYQAQIEGSFGHLAFETETVKNSVGAVNQAQFYYLTEDQAIFIATLSRNSEKVVEFKIKLVKAFQEAKKALQAISNQNEAIASIAPHIERPVQITNAKGANSFAFKNGNGKEDAINWNRKVSMHFTGKMPHELKEWAKKKGVLSKDRNSGKEVIRKFRPDKAAGVSIADWLHSNGAPDEEALRIGEQAIPVVNTLLKYQQAKQLK